MDNCLHLLELLLQRCPDQVHGLVTCDDVLHANSEAVENKPVVDHILSLTQEGRASLCTELFPDDVNDAAARIADLAFGQLTAEQLAIPYEDVFVKHASPVMDSPTLVVSRVLNLREYQAHHLLACPEALWFQNCRWWNLVDVIDPHAQIVEVLSRDEGITLREYHATKQRVLYYPHDWLVGLRIHDLFRDNHDLFDLCDRLKALRHMHVHLVAVKVSIVG